ncbi:unnamed protein product [Protopolystoma xenopodis]|uniref:Uncharacterized protein n=1 Tax=Protopolystoma xenopodis TaxID=117903 RepID=A0A3S4ZJL8_9PLAT|nr:unnamed protein product [Protopolystoma xenopodis]
MLCCVVGNLTYQAVLVVTRQVELAQAVERPECLFFRHVDEECSGNRRLGLAIADLRHQERIRFEQVEQSLLSETGMSDERMERIKE